VQAAYSKLLVVAIMTLVW